MKSKGESLLSRWFVGRGAVGSSWHEAKGGKGKAHYQPARPSPPGTCAALGALARTEKMALLPFNCTAPLKHLVVNADGFLAALALVPGARCLHHLTSRLESPPCAEASLNFPIKDVVACRRCTEW
jgi:hypothetical protein